MNSLESLLRQLSPFQRIYIVGAAVASAAVLALFVSFASKPDYQPAFTRLSSADAGAVSEALRTAKIDFQLADAGATVMVPASSLAAARVAASAAGFSPDSGAPGMELFNESNFGMSEFDQRVTYQRAKEGELARTIKMLEGVSEARVTVVAAETGLLSQDDRPATASVVITMQDGGQPDRSMVRGIVSTVASSIAGLSSDDVTVVDDSGRVLAGPQMGGTSEALVAQDTVERSIAAKIQNLVDQAVGVGKSSIAVSATLDFTKVAEQITTYTPVNDQNYTPVSVHLSNEALGGAAGLGAGGIPGTASNIPGLPTYTLPGAAASAAPAPSPAPAASLAPGATPDPLASASPAPSAAAAAGYGSTDVTVNYNLSQKIENIVREPGVLERLSVAVLIDETAAAGIEPATLKAAIEAAIGADLARGDVVSVTPVAFAVVEPAPEPDTLAPIMEMLPGVATTVLAVIIGLVLTLLLWRNMGALGRRAEEATLMAEMPRQAMLGAGVGYAGTDSAQSLLAAAPSNNAQAQIQDRLRIVADEKPEALVGLMNGWLAEEGAKR